MARIAGVDLPREKRVEAGLLSIFGIGMHRASQLCEIAGIDPDTRVKALSDTDINKLSAAISNNFKVEGDLRREVTGNIKRLMEINCYRGIRHKRGLPVNGQRTHTNARTRKGPRGASVAKKK